MIELYLSTDGKHTVHAQSETKEEMDKLLPYAKALYLKLVQELGTKAQMWTEAINGNGKLGTSQDGKTNGQSKFGVRIDSPEQIQNYFVPLCRIHNKKMKRRTGQYGDFWSCGTRLSDGSWCNYRPEEQQGVNL